MKDSNDRNVQRGNYPSGTIKIVPDDRLQKICAKLSDSLSAALQGVLKMPDIITGINTEELETKGNIAFQQNRRFAAQCKTIPSFFKGSKDKIKTEFMVGAMEVKFKNSPPIKLLAISGDFPLYTKTTSKPVCCSGYITDITIYKSKGDRSKISGKINDGTKWVTIEAKININNDQREIFNTNQAIGEHLQKLVLKGVMRNPKNDERDGRLSGVIISGNIITKVNNEEKVVATIKDFIVESNKVVQGDASFLNRRELFTFQYDGFTLINDPDFHTNFKTMPVYNLFAEQLSPDIKLLKTCAAQKLFAYLNFQNANNRLHTKCNVLKDIENISLYETWFRDRALVAQDRNWSTTDPVNSCSKCKALLPALTMKKEHITADMISSIGKTQIKQNP